MQIVERPIWEVCEEDNEEICEPEKAGLSDTPCPHRYKKQGTGVKPWFGVSVKLGWNTILPSLSKYNSGCPDLLCYVLPTQETRWCWEGTSKKEMYHEEREKQTWFVIQYDENETNKKSLLECCLIKTKLKTFGYENLNSKANVVSITTIMEQSIHAKIAKLQLSSSV